MSWGSELRGQRGERLAQRPTGSGASRKSRCKALGEDGSFSLLGRLSNPQPKQGGAGSITPNSQATGPGQQRRSHPQPPTANMDVPFIHNLVSTCGEGSFKPHPCSGTPHGPEKRQSSDSLSNRGTPKDTVSTSRARHKGLHDRKCPELGSGFMGARDWKAPVGS